MDEKKSLVKIGLIINKAPIVIYKNFIKNQLKLRTVKEAINLIDINFEKHPNWKGGLILNSKGTRFLRCIGNNKYMQEDRYQYLLHNQDLKEIPNNYVIHHMDLNKLNNQIDNLRLMKRAEHTILHNKLRNGEK